METIFTRAEYQPHLKAQTESYQDYVATLLFLLKHKIEIPNPVRGAILAVAMTLKHHLLAQYLLSQYKLPDVLKTCELLDGHRRLRQLNRKLQEAENENRKIRKTRLLTEADKLTKMSMAESPLRLNRSQVQFLVTYWVNQQKSQELEYYTSMFPVAKWRELANYLHPRREDFQLDWFLGYVFGEEPPVDSLVMALRNLNQENLTEFIMTHTPDYSFLRTLDFELTNEVKDMVAGYSSLDTLLWYWEELATPYTQAVMVEKLNQDETVDLPYGKLMERLMMIENGVGVQPEIRDKLYQMAEEQMSEYELNVEHPVLVLGDASASMHIAVRTSTIIASILCALTDARLHMFRNNDQYIENPPTTVKEVIQFALACKACRSTAPAASLYPYYESKTVVKTIVVVTDEYENGYSPNHMRFNQLYQAYSNEVYPAKLVFITFKQRDFDAPMVRDLKKLIPGIEERLAVFRMDPNRPDLSRLDHILNSLSLQKKNTIDLNVDVAAEMTKSLPEWHLIPKGKKAGSGDSTTVFENMVIDL